MKQYHDRSHTWVCSFKKGEKVQVKTTLPGGKKWIWLSGTILKKKGPRSYLVIVGRKIGFCHIDHLINTEVELPLEQEPVATPVPINIKTPSQTSSQGQISSQSGTVNQDLASGSAGRVNKDSDHGGGQQGLPNQ